MSTLYGFEPPPQRVILDGGWFGQAYELTIGTTSVRIADANEMRKGLALCNSGATTIRVAFTSDQTQTNGFPLLSNATISVGTHAELWAWVATGTSTLGIFLESR